MLTAFVEEDSTMAGYGAKQVWQLEWQRIVPANITLIFRKIEGYIPSG